MPNEYVTLVEFKARFYPAGLVDTTDDAVIDAVREGVSRWIDTSTGRRFYAATQTRYFTGEFGDLLFVDDLLSVTTLKTDDDGDRVYETTWATTDYDLEPFNATLESQVQPYTRIRITPNGNNSFPTTRKGVELAGSWGYSSAIPPLIREACLLQSIRIFKRKDAPFGVIGSAEMGQLMVIPKLDPDIELMLRPFRKLELLAV